MSSELPDFKISITRKIEPNTLKVFDFLQEGHNEAGIGETMQIISIRDQEFFYDKLEPQKAYDKAITGEGEKPINEKYKFTKYRGFSALWPYVAF